MHSLYSSLYFVNTFLLHSSTRMATPSSADFSESFAHLTLDHSDKLSNTDDLSVHLLPDLQAFLELARQHDKHVQSSDLKARHEFGNHMMSNQLTPLLRNDSLAQKNMFWAADHEFPQVHKQDLDTMDGAALFRALQPFIDRYMSQMGNTRHSARSAHESADNEAFLDVDLKVDDTFDNIRRHSVCSNRPSSPLTSPPQSSESHLDSRGTFVDEDLCRPTSGLRIGETNSKSTNARKESKVEMEKELQNNLQTYGGQDDDLEVSDLGELPQVEMPDLTADEIDMGQNDRAHEQVIAQLRLELEQYKQDNAELVNELQFLRKQKVSQQTQRVKDQEGTKGEFDTNSNKTHDNRDELNERKVETTDKKPLETTKSQIQDQKINFGCDCKKSTSIDKNNLPEEFRQFYDKLQLAKVDELSSVEKSNVIKNIMLSLLVTDFDHLALAMPQVGSYLRMTSKFLDDLHSRLYENNEVGPLRYLRDYNLHTSDGLQECLDGMFSKTE